MKAMLDLVARHKSGQACGIYSVCSAHPLVIEAACVHALNAELDVLLIEATCNQVNQDGGYTGMTPDLFWDFVHAIARNVGLPVERVLLGGDHLGPNPWTRLPAQEADRVQVTAGDLPLVRADYVQIALVFTNLLGNAVKYTPAGSPIHVSLRWS